MAKCVLTLSRVPSVLSCLSVCLSVCASLYVSLRVRLSLCLSLSLFLSLCVCVRLHPCRCGLTREQDKIIATHLRPSVLAVRMQHAEKLANLARDKEYTRPHADTSENIPAFQEQTASARFARVHVSLQKYMSWTLARQPTGSNAALARRLTCRSDLSCPTADAGTHLHLERIKSEVASLKLL